MMPLALQPLPNQKFQVTLDNLAYDIELRTIGDMAYMDVTINGVVIGSTMRCVIGQLVMPYQYMEGLGGNFVWSTISGNNPQYENFGTSDTLLYISAAELVAIRS